MARHPDIAQALGKFRPVLERAGLTGKTVLVACSGGRDSVATLGLVECLRRAMGLELWVGHVDHALRPESAVEVETVRMLAERLGVGFEVRRLSLTPGANLAERARSARRDALEDMAGDRKAAGIVLGHTATDQAETVLMNLARGTGLVGLCGMRAVDAPYVRPALELTREQTEALCGHLGLGFVDDPTNEVQESARIRMRKQVLPLLELQNPRAVTAIAGAAQRLQDVEAELERAAQRSYATLRTPEGLGLGEPDPSAMSRAVLSKVVRRALTDHGAADVPAATVAAIEASLIEHALGSRGRGPSGGARPRSFHVRPSKRVTVDRRGLTVSAHDGPEDSNH